MTYSPVALCPRDGVFFKDGRGWATSTMGRAGAYDWPFPPTVLGAVRSVWGRAQENTRGGDPFSKAEWVTHTKDLGLGSTLPLRRHHHHEGTWKQAHRMWPVPADALFLESESKVTRLVPTGLPAGVQSLGTVNDPALEQLLWCKPDSSSRAKPLPAPRWWDDKTFREWLDEKQIDQGHWAKTPLRRTDVRLAIEADRQTAKESALYSLDIVEPLAEDGHLWSIGAQVALPAGGDATTLDDALLVLGGNSRVGVVEATDDEVFDAPPAEFFPERSRGLRAIVCTPASFENGWLPDGFAVSSVAPSTYVGTLPGLDGVEVVLRAALVPRATHWSGWNMEKGGPRSTLRLVPAGSVYFFEKVSGQPFVRKELKALWLGAWGNHCELGLGRWVAGPWTINS